jgi:hypothetical protein
MLPEMGEIIMKANGQIDAVYITKYRHYAASIIKRITSAEARAATIKLIPCS